MIMIYNNNNNNNNQRNFCSSTFFKVLANSVSAHLKIVRTSLTSRMISFSSFRFPVGYLPEIE